MAENSLSSTGVFQSNRVQPDFAYWAKMATWDYEETAGLFLGFNPKAFNAENGLLRRLPDGAIDAFHSLRELAKAAQYQKQIKRPHKPMHWLEWAEVFDVSVPPVLAAEIRKWDERRSLLETAQPVAPTSPEPPAPPPAPAPASDVTTRERESMLKIIIGMGVSGYRYDPKAQRTNAVKQIEADLERAGVPVIDDTIRKYLREGAALLPPKED